MSPEIELEDHDDNDSLEPASIIISSHGQHTSTTRSPAVPNYDAYRIRLAPLIQLEDRLTRLLSSPGDDEPTRLPSYIYDKPSNYRMNTASGFVNGMGRGRPAPTLVIPETPPSPIPSITSGSRSATTEVSVHTSVNWKKSFALGGSSKSPKSAHSGEIEGWWEDPDDPVHVLHACAPVMIELWKDSRVRQQLREKRLRLEESSGLFVPPFI